MSRIDITGHKYGRLTVLGYSHTKSKKAYWKCVCECGNEVTVRSNDLRTGHTKSCGCYSKEISSEIMQTVKPVKKKKHGQTGSKLYDVWSSMKSRCHNSKNKQYKDYGGRGIKVCDEWHEFKKFYDWAIKTGYEEGLTIERIDVNKNYEPNNCEWIKNSRQARNKTNTRFIEVNGKRKRLTEWGKILDIPYGTLYTRYELGYRGEKLITKEHGNKRAD